MRVINIPRQLLVLMVVSSLVVISTAGMMAYSLRQALQNLTVITRDASLKSGLTFKLLGAISDRQGDVQSLLRIKDADELDKVVATINKQTTNILQLINDCGAKTSSVQEAYDKYLATDKQVIDEVLKGDLAQANEKYINSDAPAFDHLITCIQQYSVKIEELSQAMLTTQRASIKKTIYGQLGIIGVVLVGMFAFSWQIRRRIVAGLTLISSELEKASDQLTHSSSELASSSQAVSEGANEQAASLEETSASIEEMTGMTRQNSENASKAKALANQTRLASDTGQTDMEKMKQAMQEIQASSNSISIIIKTIDDVAFQTQILALNAAVEAARAGEAGMGFAVVATEVRNLAQRCTQSAKETTVKIDESIARSTKGGEICAKVAQSLEEITTRARTVDDLVAGIATASDEQARGIEQVSIAISQMDKVTQTNASNAEESASAAEHLGDQAKKLKDLVDQLSLMIGHDQDSLPNTKPQKNGRNAKPETVSLLSASRASQPPVAGKNRLISRNF